MTDELIHFGDEVKALGEGRLGGYLVRFGSPSERDLQGEYFTKDTYFGPRDGDGADTTFNHTQPLPNWKSLPANVRKSMEGMGDIFLPPLKAIKDDVGIFAETVMDMSDQYQRMLYELGEKGHLSWSSGTSNHMARRKNTGEITRWPIIEGALTPIPAEYRNKVTSLKSLQDSLTETPESQEVTPEASTDASALTGEQEAPSEPVQTQTIIEVIDMAEQDAPNTQEQEIAGLKAENAKFAANLQDMMEYIGSQKKLRSAGYVTDDGGAADPHVKSMGDFFLAVARGDSKRLQTVYKSHAAVKTDLVEDSGELGGWMIPEEFDARLLAVRNNMNSFINKIPRVSVKGPSGRWPRLDIFNAPTAGTGNTAEAAGLTGAVRAEGGAFTETNPLLEQIEWRVNDAIAGSIQVSKEVRADAPQLEGLLMQLIALNDITKQEFFVLRGSGVGQPLGVLNSAAMIAVTTATNDIFAYADALNMLSRCYIVDQSRTCWVHHPGILRDVGVFEVGTGGAVIVANPTGPMPNNIMGYERFQSQHSPQANSSGDAILCDFSQYQIWDLGGAYVDFSEHVGFLNGLDTWRFGRRIDGKPLWLSTMTLSDPTGSYTQSPFVKHDD